MGRVEEASDQLANVDLFDGLFTSALANVAMVAEERAFEPGEAMVSKGEAGRRAILPVRFVCIG